MPRRSEVELDPPLAVPLSEVERMAADASPPLLWSHASITRDDHIGVARQPSDKFVLFGRVRCSLSPSFRASPVRIHPRDPLGAASFALFGGQLTRARKAVVVKVA